MVVCDVCEKNQYYMITQTNQLNLSSLIQLG